MRLFSILPMPTNKAWFHLILMQRVSPNGVGKSASVVASKLPSNCSRGESLMRRGIFLLSFFRISDGMAHADSAQLSEC